MSRKIIQLCVSGSDMYGDFVYALGDDGSMWSLNSAQDTWKRLPEVPQYEDRPCESCVSHGLPLYNVHRRCSDCNAERSKWQPREGK